MTAGDVGQVRECVAAAAAVLGREGLPVPSLDGKLLRPSVALAALPSDVRPGPGEPFWFGALAIEMVHEASLLHDDILDDASERRGAPTLAARAGTARALVRGDHLLTAAYRAAGHAEAPGFMRVFVRAVERTVAGEIRQGEGAGRTLTWAEYRSVIEGKSGELFGAAHALAAEASGDDLDAAAALGRRLGGLYQMVDDFLDYCPGAAHGKPPLQDLRQGKWTFVLLDYEGGLDAARRAFERDPDGLARDLVRRRPGGSVLGRALARLEVEADEVCAGLRPALRPLITSWVDAARTALEGEEATRRRAAVASSHEASVEASAEAEVVALARAVGGPDHWGAYFAHHSRSFRFASRIFPADARRHVEAVYAFCRFTDDLVDEARVAPATARARLETWGDLVGHAHEGGTTGVPLADLVMAKMRTGEVPFGYVRDLLAGVATDLDPVRFRTQAELDLYTYRVASVVGGWLTELFGVHEPEVLARAYDLGHAMQLTNIVRDVGEDWRRGRLYLPEALLADHGVDEALVDRVAGSGAPVPDAWAELTEALMAQADRRYERAFEALPALPGWYARPVAVAARVYQGIHDALRRNGYDNGTLRAHTGGFDKVRLGARGLLDLRQARRRAGQAVRAWQGPTSDHAGRSPAPSSTASRS